MKTRLVFGGLIVLLLVFLAWFGLSGGFDTVEVTNEQDYQLVIFGQEYKGALGSKEASRFFSETEAVLDGKPMYVFYDGKPTKENEYSSNVIAGGLVEFEGSSKKKLFFDVVFKARHDAHYMLNKAQTNIFNAAKEKGEVLDLTKMIEIYHTKNDVEVVIPVLKK